MHHAIASIRPRYVEMLLEGTKTVELRRRRVHLPDQTLLWLYSTLPVGDVVAVASVARVHHGTPTSVWRRFAMRLGLTLFEYCTYTSNALWVTAIELERVVPLLRPVPLREIREFKATFHPPQSIVAIDHKDPVLTFLIGILPGEMESLRPNSENLDLTYSKKVKKRNLRLQQDYGDHVPGREG